MARYHERDTESDSEMEVEDDPIPNLFPPGDEDVPVATPVAADDDLDSDAGAEVPMFADDEFEDEMMYDEVAGIVTGDDGDFDDGRSVGGDD
jgi:hypothetical protein